MPVRRQELAEAVMRLIDKSRSSKQAAKAIAGYLVAERRTKELPALLRVLEEHQMQQQSRLEVTATAASPLNENSKRAIRRLFDAKHIVVHEEINPDVIGGVRVRALDKVADFSVQTRLRRLRQGRNL